jgi:hypothetical protein
VEVKYEADEDEICIIVAATSAMTNDPGTLAVEYDMIHVIYYIIIIHPGMKIFFF